MNFSTETLSEALPEMINVFQRTIVLPLMLWFICKDSKCPKNMILWYISKKKKKRSITMAHIQKTKKYYI